METFKQYHNKVLSEMSDRQLPPRQLKQTAAQVIQSASRAARGKESPEEMENRLRDLSIVFKQLDQYNSEDIKGKIMSKYRAIQQYLSEPQEHVEITAETLMDCVNCVTELYDNIVMG